MSAKGDLAQRYIDELWKNHNLDATSELFAPDHLYWDPYLPEPARGPEGAQARAAAYLGVFSDGVVTENELYEDGDLVFLPWTFVGTHDGEIEGNPPTGKRITIEGLHVFRIPGDRIAETRAYWWDLPGAMRDLGLMAI
ncbi:MAG: ester cyclase [Thermoleophilia bacterium]|nr:ester cyclase [Thermoleophilia bacterium]